MSDFRFKFERNKKLADDAIDNLKSVDRFRLKLSDGFIKWKGGKLRLRLAESKLFQWFLYKFNIEYFIHKYSKSYKSLVVKKIRDILSTEDLKKLEDNNGIDALVDDILYCHKLYKSSPSEYFLYGFREKDDTERSKYVTDKYLLSKLSMTGMRSKHDVELNEKYNFYLLTKPFFKRKSLIIPPPFTGDQFSLFKQTVSGFHRLIFKPTSLGCGDGIFISDVDSEGSIKKVFDRILKSEATWVAEELIEQVPEMAAWNNSSVNTIRLNTFYKDGLVEFGTSFMRMGRKGADVDNAGIGGTYAIVDTETGTLLTDGHDEQNNKYVTHPDSGLKYKGWQVPHWDELIEMSKIIHSIVFPKMPYVSWDFALTSDGWVLIEGNWGQFVAQQSALGIGLRHEFDKYIK